MFSTGLFNYRDYKPLLLVEVGLFLFGQPITA